MITCEEVESLAPFYAAGALRDSDTAEIETHLHSCREHVQMLSAFRATAEPERIVEVALPPALKAKIMAAVHAGARPALSGGRARSAISGVPLALVAASVAVALVALGALLWSLEFGSTQEDSAFAISLRGANGASATLFYVYGEKKGVIAVEGLPSLPAESTYQVWAASANGPQSCGLIETTYGSAAFARMEGDVSRNQLVFVTVEPAGGSSRPTGATVLTSKTP